MITDWNKCTCNNFIMINIGKYDSAETNPYILILLLQCNKTCQIKKGKG